ncbi:Rossmann fold domain-containing protein [Qipengyuania marisflavi]|uniref:Short chain dehydrogenase-like proteobacteria domain-containing protein n=1 Tax=Qipengyuania marisflavi TaxID=2486356 RepID=A0A5S3P6W1_9SPHN|nr:hypothetical protein [Qipengyuania marisflavi]TMM48963.1 hypothetical protein FEV51_06185 [Qipengyuania marisflavi]
MKRFIVDELPSDPLRATGVFHQHWLPRIEAVLTSGQDVMLVLPAADYTHREWRRAAIAMLARSHTPRRINAVTGQSTQLAVFERYLTDAHGVTGQYLEGAGATGENSPR